MIYEEFKADVFKEIKKMPSQWRKGQKVFNYIDYKYHVARDVQFKRHVDCFYRDDLIDEFMETAYKLL